MAKKGAYRNSIQQALWDKADVRGEDDCWEWQAGKCGLSREYGQTMYQGKHQLAHRLAYAVTYGEIPEGKDILHSCDNPSCINPKHLSVGTHTDNMRDMFSKGRWKRKSWDRTAGGKLTGADILKIRELLSQGFSHRKIGKMFGISNPLVSYIRTGKRWTHITE